MNTHYLIRSAGVGGIVRLVIGPVGEPVRAFALSDWTLSFNSSQHLVMQIAPHAAATPVFLGPDLLDCSTIILELHIN
jgi:hypothetical protein